MNTKQIFVTFAAISGGGIVGGIVDYLNAPNRAYSQCKQEYLDEYLPDKMFDRCRPKNMEFDSDCLGLASLLMTAAREHARSCEKKCYDNYESDPNFILIGMGIGMGLILSLPNTIEGQINAEPVSDMHRPGR